MATPVATADAPASLPSARPTGVTILAVLSWIGAGLMALAGMIFMVASAAFGSAFGSLGAMFAVFGAAIGIFILGLAVLYAFNGYGLWARKRWAWFLTMVLTALGLLSGLMALLSMDVFSALLNLGVSGLVAWYMLSPGVQSWFGTSYNTPWKYGA